MCAKTQIEILLVNIQRYKVLKYRGTMYNQTCPWGHLYYAVTYIERSPVYCPVIENIIWIEPLLIGYLSYKATFSLFQRSWPLNTGLTVLKYRDIETLWIMLRFTNHFSFFCQGGFCLGSFCQEGLLSRWVLSVGFCPKHIF